MELDLKAEQNWLVGKAEVTCRMGRETKEDGWSCLEAALVHLNYISVPGSVGNPTMSQT